MAFTHSDLIAVKRIKGKGRGVFARRPIKKGEVIERVPMIVMSAKEYEEDLSGSRLSHYCFAWGRNQVALALGYGSIYNHSYSPNARYEDVGPQTKVFLALRAIESGEEITVNYNGKPKSRSAVWFKVIEPSTSTSPKPRRGARPGVNGKS
jgi:SET domain-containing protein